MFEQKQMAKKISLVLASLCALCFLSGHSAAAERKPATDINQRIAKQRQRHDSDEAKLAWNLKNVNIRQFIKQVAEQTGKNFIIDPRVQGEVTIVSAHPLTPDQLYQVFLSTLQIHGYAVISAGAAYKVIPSKVAQAMGGDSNSTQYYGMSDDYVVNVIPVRYVPVEELQKVLQNFTDKSAAVIQSYAPTNDIIVADYQRNIERLKSIISRVDHPLHTKVEIIRLRHAHVDDLVSMLNDLRETKSTANSKDPTTFAADSRTNSIIIQGGENERLRYRMLVARMDVPGNNEGDVHVVYLKYVRAHDIAPILANVVDSFIKRSEKTKDSQTPYQAEASNNNTTFQNNNNSLLGGNNSATPNTGTTSRLNNLPNFGSLENQSKSGAVGRHVQWEATTNAVIIKAPPPVMRIVRRVIDKLDIRRPQVLVETVIAEIAVDRNRDLGIEWNSSGNVRGSTRFPNGLSSLNGTLSGTGLGGSTSGFIPASGLSVGFLRGGNIRVLLRALSLDSTTNILSTPNVVTLDNETATIKVGQLVPFATGSNTNNLDNGGTPFTSFTREEVGLTLTIRPQITQSGAIKLQINHILSNVIPGSADPNKAGNPTTAERVISTNVMAKLDIAEKRLPQDGRIGLQVAGHGVDMRVSTMPTAHGERIVLRLLDKKAGRLDLAELGLSERNLKLFKDIIENPHGIVLVTGPTGSGKTTTLYAALSEINDVSRNILTVEDPIEYNLPGIGQTQVNRKVEMTFAKGLRAMLRQDPDVVMVGEIRDLETAQIAVQASLTGHLVFSTLHTNTALGAIIRLSDMGIEPFLLASSLVGLVAQRLVRKLCSDCKRAVTADHSTCTLLKVDAETAPQIYEPVGCEQCQGSGYRGRQAIYEIIRIDDTIAQMIHDNAAEQALTEYARQYYPSIRDDGISLVLAGHTSLEEVLRVTAESKHGGV